MTDKTIPTGSSGDVKMQFNTAHRVGATSESIKVHSNDPDEPLVYLTIVGFVHGIPAVIPAQVYLGKVSSKQLIEKRVKVVEPVKQGFKVIGVETTSKHIAAKEVSSQQGQEETEIEIVLRPSAPIGVIDEKLVIHTNNGPKPKIEIPIEGEIVGEITVFPARFFFGIIKRGEAPSRKIEISKAGEKNLEIESVNTNSEFISVRADTLKKDSQYAIVARLSESIPPGTVRDTVEVRTNNSEQPVLNISLYALVIE